MAAMMQTNHPNQPVTVVVAEDSPMQALNITELLTGAGLQVFWAQNGVDCLQLVNQKHPGLILLDLEMPEMNGLQTLAALKQKPETNSIPIIMLTRHDDPEFAQLGFQSGVVDYIPKDAFANAVLIETLTQLGIISGKQPEDGAGADKDDG